MQVWGKAADSALILKVITAAGDAPAAWFERIAAKKLSRSDSARKHSPGLLALLAADAAEAWTQDRVDELVRADKSATSTRQITDKELAAMAEWDRQCHDCNATGNAGIWHTGVFTPRKPLAPCTKCKGTGQKAATR